MITSDAQLHQAQTDIQTLGVSWKRLVPRTHRSTISAWPLRICSNCKSDSKR